MRTTKTTFQKDANMYVVRHQCSFGRSVVNMIDEQSSAIGFHRQMLNCGVDAAFYDAERIGRPEFEDVPSMYMVRVIVDDSDRGYVGTFEQSTTKADATGFRYDGHAQIIWYKLFLRS